MEIKHLPCRQAVTDVCFGTTRHISAGKIPYGILLQLFTPISYNYTERAQNGTLFIKTSTFSCASPIPCPNYIHLVMQIQS